MHYSVGIYINQSFDEESHIITSMMRMGYIIFFYLLLLVNDHNDDMKEDKRRPSMPEKQTIVY
jgi:hypothetical protein